MTPALQRCVWGSLLVYAGLQSANAQPAASRPSTTQVGFYRKAARDVTDYIQRTFWDEQTGLYRNSLREKHPAYMWGNGVMFSALVAAARQDPATYQPLLERFFASMDRYWDSKTKIPGYEPAPTRGNGNDKYYDDNEWMVLTFLEAYDLTREQKYLDRADAALKFALSGWDDTLGGGIWWHEGHKGNGKNTCSNAPAAFACVRMAKYRQREEYIAWARRILAWTSKRLQDSDGLFFDGERVDTGHVNKDKLTYNTALMLRANLGLYRATGEQRFMDEAKRINAACEWFIGADGAYRDEVKWSHLQLEADLEFYRATGDERAMKRAQDTATAALATFRAKPPSELIEAASVARMLWLMAEVEKPH